MASELRRSVARLVAMYAHHRPDLPALVTPFGSRNYLHLHDNANALANLFVAAGLEPGDRVLLLCDNRPEFVETMIAGERAGLSIIPLVYDLTPPELRYVIGDSAARACVVDAVLNHSVSAILDDIAQMTLRLVVAGSLAGFAPYEDAIAAAPRSRPHRPRGFPIYYTSGTTGKPKAVKTRFDIAPLAELLRTAEGFRRDVDSMLCAFPLSQPGLFDLAVFSPLAFGATARLLTSDSDVATILETIAREKITHAHLSPYLFHLLRERGPEFLAQYNLSSLRCVIHGGGPCPVELKRWAIRQFGPIVAEYYAATEGGGLCISSAEWLRKPGSVGKPSPNHPICILDESGNTCPPGTVGLVYFRTPADFRFAYLGDPAKTEAAYRGDYFTVRDLGYIDEDGYLFLVGRDADIVNVNEDNVYPEEIDQALGAHPAVADALSFSIPAPDKGEKIVSLVRLRFGGLGGERMRAALFEHCEQTLARYKRPALIEFADVLPRSSTGKKQRHRAREEFLSRRMSHALASAVATPGRRG